MVQGQKIGDAEGEDGAANYRKFVQDTSKFYSSDDADVWGLTGLRIHDEIERGDNHTIKKGTMQKLEQKGAR